MSSWDMVTLLLCPVGDVSWVQDIGVPRSASPGREDHQFLVDLDELDDHPGADPAGVETGVAQLDGAVIGNSGALHFVPADGSLACVWAGRGASVFGDATGQCLTGAFAVGDDGERIDVLLERVGVSAMGCLSRKRNRVWWNCSSSPRAVGV